MEGTTTYRRWLSPKTKTRSPEPAGRPVAAEDIVTLILRMATENLSWGYKRIFGELKKLSVAVGLSTIRDILKRSDGPPPPEETKSRPNIPWSKFVSAHMESLVACDFFTKPVYTLRGRFDAYALVFLHLGSRRVLSQPILHPTEAWVRTYDCLVSIYIRHCSLMSLLKSRDVLIVFYKAAMVCPKHSQYIGLGRQLLLLRLMPCLSIREARVFGLIPNSFAAPPSPLT
jgi:hypothetical protein